MDARRAGHHLGTHGWLRLLVAAALVLVLVLTLEASPAAGASSKACRVRNTDSGRSYRSPQAAVDAARPGARLVVKGTCVGATELGKDLVIEGVKTRRWGKPILDGARKTRLLYVRRVATVTVRNLTIQHGRASCSWHGVGGGIANFGTLTLRNVVVRDNFAANGGGGIYNQGILTLAGRTSIRDNGGVSGIYSVGCSAWTLGVGTAAEGERPSVTMNDASSVSGHKHSGVYVEGGTLTMNDDSSIFGNKSTEGGGVELVGARLIMNDASSIHDNRANETGGGVDGAGALTMNDASSIHDNRAVAADGTPGQGGGLWYWSWWGEPNPIGVTCGPGGNVYGNTPDDCYFYVE